MKSVLRVAFGIVLVFALTLPVVQAQDKPVPIPDPLNAAPAALSQSDVCANDDQNKLESFVPVVLGPVLILPNGDRTTLIGLNSGLAVQIIAHTLHEEALLGADGKPSDLIVPTSAVEVRAQSVLPEAGEPVTLLNIIAESLAQEITVARCEDGFRFHYDPLKTVPYTP